MSAALMIAVMYLAYFVLAGLVAYVLLSRAARAGERAATAALDLELRELIAREAPVGR